MAKSEDCPNESTETHSTDEMVYPDDDPQVIADFFLALSANTGWEVECVSYEAHQFYCPPCKAKHEAA